ncbi:MAG TPA: ATP-binding protein [Saprospiraceae bacterium]|nr:ATP-binding protein [Saprospiraceae bacterium]
MTSGISTAGALHVSRYLRFPASVRKFPCVVVALIVSLVPIWAQTHFTDDLIVKELEMRRAVKALVLDSEGFLWIGTEVGVYRFDGYDFELAGGETLPYLQLPASNITQMLSDKNDNIWVCTQSGVYVIDTRRSHVVQTDESFAGDRVNKEITSMIEVDDEIWLVDLSSGIKCFPRITETTQDLVPKRQILIPGYILRFLFRLGDGNVLVSTSGSRYFVVSPAGDILATFEAPFEYPAFYADSHSNQAFLLAETSLYQLDPYHNTVTPEISFKHVTERHSPTWFLNGQYRDKQGYWMGNKMGNLHWYSKKEKRYLDFTPILSDRIYGGRFFSTHIGIRDGEDGIWIGTNQGLIHAQVPQQQNFSKLPSAKSGNRQNFSVRGMLRAPDQSLFVGGYSGLFRYFPDGTIKEYRIWNEDAQKRVNPLVYDFLLRENELWLATEGNGLMRFDFRLDSLYWSIPTSSLDSLDERQREILWLFRIMEDHEGTVWLGTINGLHRIIDSGTPMRFEAANGSPDMYKVFDIRESADGTLWIGSANGLYSISPDRVSVQSHTARCGLTSEVTCIYPIDDGHLIIGTKENGIKLYHPERGDVVSYTTEHGLANDAICAIQSAQKDVFWISTNSGLSRFNMAEQKFRNYYLEDGLPDNEFNHGSWMTDSDGSLYFGGVRGVVRINLQDGDMEETPTGLRVSKIAYHDGKSGTTKYLTPMPDDIPVVRLGFRDKYFTVFYSTTQCIPNSRQAYAYMLEGLHSDWQSNDTKNFVQFTGLQAGNYTLKIRLLESSVLEDQNILRIPIFIARPFYQQWWAYLIYIGVIGGVSFQIFRGYFQRKHIHRRLQLESEHRLKLEEINKSKSTFFTNITHEFKTPLTLIQGPAEEIARISKDDRVNRHANLIAKNARAMLSLVNQLLELGKLETKLEQPHFYRLDLAYHLRAWVGNFDSLAKQKHIELIVRTEHPSIYVDFDPVKLETVINNLLSNAMKFAPEHGHVECITSMTKGESGNDLVSIAIQDDGPGIDPAEQEYIFERFYQGKNSQLGGTGIGLAFVREMVRIHHGSIGLDSAPGKGTRFTVLLPLFQDEVEQKEYSSTSVSDAATSDTLHNVFRPLPSDEMSVLLIAEDNTDVAQLIKDAFDKDFQVLITHNGRDAHQKALEMVPDLVITDVMMPIMDGLSLTHQLKTDIHTNHIPVIMLTAKDGLASRIEGLTHGADVYLNKPFSVNELKLTVRNLLYLRAQVQQSVSKQMAEDVDGIQFANDQDSSFYHSFLKVLEQNISEPGLSVQDFMRDLGVSRTQLHRKLKAITGQSVNQIVRGMRLQKGLSLLKHSGKTISEVAYEVGFSSPSYFTERFREYYGYPPSEAITHSRSESI